MILLSSTLTFRRCGGGWCHLLWFLLFSMCYSLHFAVNVCINCSFLHLYNNTGTQSMTKCTSQYYTNHLLCTHSHTQVHLVTLTITSHNHRSTLLGYNNTGTQSMTKCTSEYYTNHLLYTHSHTQVHLHTLTITFHNHRSNSLGYSNMGTHETTVRKSN